VGPRADLDNVGRENSWPYRDLNSDPLVIKPVASHCTDYTIPTPLTVHFMGIKYHEIMPSVKIYEKICLETS
jgi:hypothetical protein